MKKLLIATTNPSKFREVSETLADDGLEVLGLKDFPNVKPVPETGDTFVENAVIKAKGYFEQTGIPCIADDGGLMVDALDGAPGVYSHRWVEAVGFDGKFSEPSETRKRKKFPRVSPRGRNGHEASDLELAVAILDKMQGVPQDRRTARLGGFMVFWDGKHLLHSENWVRGYIAEKLMDDIQPGFPYRPILIIPQFNKSYSALTHEEHEQVNFRRKNLKALKPQILELLK